MKKTLLFLTVFFFFTFLSAEEVQTESAPTETEIRTESEALQKKDKKPDFFYIQPAFEISFGLGYIVRAGLALDAGFLVGTVNKNTNVYLGLDSDLKLMPDYAIEENPFLSFSVLASTVFDIMLENQPVLRSVSVRISVGPAMLLSRRNDEHDIKFYPYIGWGTGFDLVFKNNMVFKFGIDDYMIFFPDIVIGFGYRF
ncbi:hypothetical protein IKS86_03460 [bacterium]|nr:hypothetical protein [bacterium]